MVRRPSRRRLQNATELYLNAKAVGYTVNAIDALDGSIDPDGFSLLFQYAASHVVGNVLPPKGSNELFKFVESKNARVTESRFKTHNFEETWGNAPKGQRREFTQIFRRLLRNDKALRQQNPFLKRLHELQTTFRLSDCACDCLTIVFLETEDSWFHDVGQSFRRRRNATLSARLNQFTAMLERPHAEIAAEVNRDAPLLRLGLVDNDFDLAQHMTDFLAGTSNDPLVSRFFQKCRESVLDITAYPHLQSHIDQMTGILRNRSAAEGVNLLLYGTPGTGKTALARSIGQAMGYTVYEINRTASGKRDSNREEDYRYAAIHACLNTVDLSQSLVIVDEADDLLNRADGQFSFLMTRRDADKPTINTLMEQHHAGVIWITNAHNTIDLSTRRRFDYSVEFTNFTRQQREQVWHKCLSTHGVTLFAAAEIAELADRYEINAGGIDLAVRNIARAVRGTTSPEDARTQALSTMSGILTSHQKLMSGNAGQRPRDANSRDYSLEGLNVTSDPPPASILTVLTRFSDPARAPELECGIRNMNLLLSGPPGTGKTEFAKYLARQLDRPLISRRASDILDCYVGNSEKQIRRAFDEAESNRGILFMDEIDSLLSDRGKAVRSWEVTQVNELLSCMENYRGIFISATNHRSGLDPAALRRFNFKVDFAYLEKTGKLVFFRKYLQSLTRVPLTAAEENDLAAMEGLTPGDFKVVWQKNAFLVGDGLTNAGLLAALEAEVAVRPQSCRNRRVGFNAAA